MKRALLSSALLMLTACGSSAETVEEVDSSSSIAETNPISACPERIVFQTDWFPEAEHGGIYELLGDDATTSKDTGATVGSLVVDGSDTGHTVEIRAGGPFLNSPVVTEMYQDDEIMFGYVGLDVAARRSTDAPVTIVFNALNVNPQILMWNAELHPGVTELRDAVDRVETIYVFGEPDWITFLADAGAVDASKVDGGYQGNPILTTEDVIHQGFVTNEPFAYQGRHGIRTEQVLLHDLGWNNYPQNLAVRTDRVDPLAECLSQIVPVLQRAQLDYIADPARTNAIIVDAVAALDSFWDQSPEEVAYGASSQRDLGIIGNGATPTFGDLESDRVADFLAKVLPILRAKGTEVGDLTPEDLVDNRFLDASITYEG